MLLPPPHPRHFPHSRLKDTRQVNTTANGGRAGLPLLKQPLEDRALLPRLFDRRRAEHSPDGLVKDRLQAPLSEG